jgi:hypothetical protein
VRGEGRWGGWGEGGCEGSGRERGKGKGGKGEGWGEGDGERGTEREGVMGKESRGWIRGGEGGEF